MSAQQKPIFDFFWAYLPMFTNGPNGQIWLLGVQFPLIWGTIGAEIFQLLKGGW